MLPVSACTLVHRHNWHLLNMPCCLDIKRLEKKKEKMNTSAASSALIEFLSITFTDFKKSPHNYLFS